MKVTLSPACQGIQETKRPGERSHGDQVGDVILTVWNSCELFADRYKQLLFLVMESN